MSKIRVMAPQISELAIDSRGAILTYIPSQPIVEFNYIVSNRNAIRGFHCHTEFDEYIMLVDGEMIVTEILEDQTKHNIVLAIGQTICIPAGTPHIFISVTDCKFINFLTKTWAQCNNPITKFKL